MGCRNLIENARIAKERGSAIPVMAQEGWHCRKEKCVHHVTLMAAGNVKTVEVWADLMLMEILPLSQAMIDDWRMRLMD
jgi:hypothetical protein